MTFVRGDAVLLSAVRIDRMKFPEIFLLTGA
jgi:hypothetical protein